MIKHISKHCELSFVRCRNCSVSPWCCRHSSQLEISYGEHFPPLSALEISLAFQQTHLSVVYAGSFSCWDRPSIRFFLNTAALRPVPSRSFAVDTVNQCWRHFRASTRVWRYYCSNDERAKAVLLTYVRLSQDDTNNIMLWRYVHPKSPNGVFLPIAL